MTTVVAKPVGAHAPRIAAARALLASKGRREQRRFLFEGPTLLAEAYRSGAEIDAVYVTRAAYEAAALVQEMDRAGVPVMLVDERTAARLSAVETPTHVCAVAAQRFTPLEAMLSRPGAAVVLAGLADPGNAGTILRSAEAFAAAGVVFGSGGVEPYHPKVVRASMGSIFRIPIAVSDPDNLHRVATATRREIVGLSHEAAPLRFAAPAGALAIVVGQERRGLGAWAGVCSSFAALPMPGPAESLNAAVAASIALYEASRHPKDGTPKSEAF